MALSWTMDKLGPICRAVEDCALVLQAIYGPDGDDPTVKNAGFHWDASLDWRKLRVGYLKTAFEPQPETPQPEEPAATPEEQKQRDEQKKRREAGRARDPFNVCVQGQSAG